MLRPSKPFDSAFVFVHCTGGSGCKATAVPASTANERNLMMKAGPKRRNFTRSGTACITYKASEESSDKPAGLTTSRCHSIHPRTSAPLFPVYHPQQTCHLSWRPKAVPRRIWRSDLFAECTCQASNREASRVQPIVRSRTLCSSGDFFQQYISLF